jgi:hypothetical protein
MHKGKTNPGIAEVLTASIWVFSETVVHRIKHFKNFCVVVSSLKKARKSHRSTIRSGWGQWWWKVRRWGRGGVGVVGGGGVVRGWGKGGVGVVGGRGG